MTKKIKILAIVCCICLLFNIVLNNITYATNNFTLDFNNEHLSINEGVAIFNVNNNNVEVKLAVKNNDTNQYTYESITDNMNIDLDAKDYYLYIDRTNSQDVTLVINGANKSIPGDNYFGLYSDDFATSNNVLLIDLQSGNSGNNNPGNNNPGNNNPGNNNPGDPFLVYDVIAKFQGISTGVISDFEGNIVMPESWTSGGVEFYARTCEVDGRLAPYHENMPCDEDSYEEVRLDIEGIVNGEQINRSVTKNGEYGNMKAIFTEDFQEYGKATFHLATPEINTIISVSTADLIFVRADAPLGMSYSLGSATIDNAILTNKETGNISIFFGNTETIISAKGTKVLGISKVVGGAGVEYNEDGTATVTLPALSKETTTKLVLTIELEDETSITKTINIARTAIELRFNRAEGNATLEAGYVVNKAYLYNNRAHSDDVFNAYLQVILYKEGIVAGYKQIKIDDEELINNLQNDESGSMELFSDNHINLYGKELNDTIEGVDSASVFLTNGPIKFDSDTLPSVEFGIGSGVTIDFGGEK